jgi:hypothetical protein
MTAVTQGFACANCNEAALIAALIVPGAAGRRHCQGIIHVSLPNTVPIMAAWSGNKKFSPDKLLKGENLNKIQFFLAPGRIRYYSSLIYRLY